MLGQTLRIPGCEAPQVNSSPEVRRTLDSDLQQAIKTTAPEGWQPRPTSVRDGLAYGDANGGIVIRQLTLADDATPQTAIADAIEQGAGSVLLPDGATAAFTNPPATGHMLVPIPAGRLIQISGEGDLAETLDYEIGTLQEWMTAVRIALG